MKKSIFIVLISLLALSSCKLVEERDLTSNAEKNNIATIEKEIIKIGSITPLGSDNSNIGDFAVNGIELAVVDANKELAPDREIIVVHEDGNCNLEDAKNATQKLISEHNVVAIIGGICSDETTGIIESMKETPIPVITLFSTSKASRSDKEWSQHLNNSDENQAQKAAEVIFNMQQIKSIFVIYDNQESSIEMIKSFEDKYKYLGGNVTDSFQIDDSENSIEKAITSYITTNEENIYIVASEENIYHFLNKLITFDQSTTIFGTEILKEDKFKDILSSPNIDFFYLSPHENNDQAWLDFASKYNIKYGILPPFSAAEGYDAMNLIANIIQKSDAITSSKIRDSLRSIKDYNGASGNIEFNQNGDNILKKWDFWHVKENAETFIGSI